MRKSRLLCVVIAILMLLCACAGEQVSPCAHEWTGGTCETGYTCAKCGEAGPGAIGHKWTEAACEARETCVLCGNTRGETLAHTYGDWEFITLRDGTREMLRTCAACGKAERSPAEWELFTAQRLPGYWGMTAPLGVAAHAIHIPDNPEGMAKAYEGHWNRYYPEYAIYAIFREDGTGSYYDLTELRDFDWTYLDYNAVQNRCLINVAFGDGSEMAMELSVDFTDGDLYVMEAGEERYVMRYEPFAEWIGQWQFSEDGREYTLEFLPDRTVTGQLPEGEVTGRWTAMLQGRANLGGKDIALLDAQLMYTVNGRTYTTNLRYFSEAPGSDWDIAIRNALLENPVLEACLCDRTAPVTLRKVS